MGATDLFVFRFKGDLDDHACTLLREATGMTIGVADYGNSPGRGAIGRAVDIYLDEWGGEGRDPDDWFIEAWTHTPHEYDHEAVEKVRQRSRPPGSSRPGTPAGA